MAYLHSKTSRRGKSLRMTTISSGTGVPRSGVSAVPLHVLGFWVLNLQVFRYKHSPMSFLDCNCLFNRHCLIVPWFIMLAKLQEAELLAQCFCVQRDMIGFDVRCGSFFYFRLCRYLLFPSILHFIVLAISRAVASLRDACILAFTQPTLPAAPN